MYHTPKGIRILLGAERKFFEQALGTVVDLLATGDMDFGIELFDKFQLNQKLLLKDDLQGTWIKKAHLLILLKQEILNVKNLYLLLIA